MDVFVFLADEGVVSILTMVFGSFDADGVSSVVTTSTIDAVVMDFDIISDFFQALDRPMGVSTVATAYTGLAGSSSVGPSTASTAQGWRLSVFFHL